MPGVDDCSPTRNRCRQRSMSSVDIRASGSSSNSNSELLKRRANHLWLEAVVNSDGIRPLEWNSSRADGPATESVHRKYWGRMLVQVPSHPDRGWSRRLDFHLDPAETATSPSIVVWSCLRPVIRAVPAELAIDFGPDKKPVQREVLLVGDRPWTPPRQLMFSEAVRLNCEPASTEALVKRASIQIDPAQLGADQDSIDVNIPTSISEQPVVPIRITVVRGKMGEG